MTLENNNKVPSSSNSFCNKYDNDYDDDDGNSIFNKLALKCKKLISKKKFCRREHSKLTKSFEDLEEFFFLKINSSNKKLSLNFKAFLFERLF